MGVPRVEMQKLVSYNDRFRLGIVVKGGAPNVDWVPSALQLVSAFCHSCLALLAGPFDPGRYP
jgi:hypothetical protein